MTTETPDWTKDALCPQVDPELFFPAKQGDSPRAAKSICATCPVRQECLDQALADPSLEGIWGGTTFRERQIIRTQQRTDAA